ncbi:MULTISPECIES: phage lytic cycle repressor MrpR family protein [Peribacillus]|uniref:phage lytic cycle repressor MrpR family protein n=1 Tax=Peribacillus TaxID=2675229 RepID=UPI001F4DBD0C|nr:MULTISPECIES: HNH endonuclease [unclassified Peribacillus]MCK1981982.1 HNH endonuclease [Peribacillus sp. Aquil_B1]MCK2007666.1 HNH endonuclease [Peribacillus sp. Aquil_B8]
MFYNEKIKKNFIEHKNDSYKGLYRNIFNVSNPMEKELEKDLYDFTLDNLGDLMKRLSPTTINSSRNRYYRIFDYIDSHKTLRGDKSNPFLSVEPNWNEQFVDKTKRVFFTEKEFDDLINKCVNAQDAVVFRLLFEGVWGQSGYSELLNIKAEDIDWENNSLYLNDGKGERNLSISDKCIDLLKKAIDEKVYYFKNGESIGYRNKDKLVLNNYVIRGVDPGSRNKEKRDRFLITRRIDTIFKETFSYPNITPHSLRYSGMLKAAIDISATNHIPVKEFNNKDHWSQVAERFNVKPYEKNGYKIYKGVTDNINGELVKDIYGEIVDYINNDFELVNEDEIDIEVITKKKRIDAPVFRDLVMSVYDKCTITGENVHITLEACHIQPYINRESNHIQNGLLLRVDIHKLFDNGLIIIDDNYTVRISPLLSSDYYQSLNGKRIHLPKDKRFYPSKKALGYKMNEFIKKNDLETIAPI